MTQRISRYTLICLVLNRTIGSGIFVQPANVLFYTKSGGIALLIWVVAGLVSAALMLCWLEMGLSIPYIQQNGGRYPTPRSGGDKNYVSKPVTRSTQVRL